MTSAAATPEGKTTVMGHPAGLFVLFFAEMWERFSYYGMRALLVFYMIKGFLSYDDGRAYAVYGAYTALVYATPFVGGMLADRLLGARRAVVLGGVLMAAGHLLMTIEQSTAFFVALALLIVGNGFFKPNISTIVGTLYPAKSDRRDGGFTLFYMGINLGAALAPLLCGYVGETYGWHYGFGLATVGMLIGLAVFVAPTRVTQALIVGGALFTSIGMVVFGRNDALMLAINAPVALALLVAAAVATMAVGRGGIPHEAGRPKDPAALSAPSLPAVRRSPIPYSAAVVVAGGVLAFLARSAPVDVAMIVVATLAALAVPWVSAQASVFVGLAGAIPLLAILVQRSEIAGWMLILFGGAALASLFVAAVKSQKVERERLFVVLILMFFSMLFWAFFEQAGSSVNNFTDRNVDRVVGDRALTEADVGRPVDVKVTQEQIAYPVNGRVLSLTDVETLQKENGGTVALEAQREHVGMGVGGTELKASVFQAANPIFILLFGLVFTWLWSVLAKARLEPSTPVKFGLGLLQLGLGFGALWYGAQQADGRGMVAMFWLLAGYLLQTTGELCLSPVGLSMVTKLSPQRMVSTVMGAWFLATAFSNYLAGLIAQLTGVGHGAEGAEKVIPLPKETVDVYGGVFGQIAIAAMVSAGIVFVISPLLRRWMHQEAVENEGGAGQGESKDAQAAA